MGGGERAGWHRAACLAPRGRASIGAGDGGLHLGVDGLPAGATRLDRLLWLNIGLDGGYVLVGLTLVSVGWRLAKRLDLVGAGIGVVLQGLALALLDMVLAVQISR